MMIQLCIQLSFLIKDELYNLFNYNIGLTYHYGDRE